MAKQTTTQRLAEHLLGASLEEYVRRRRTAGESWRQISLGLRDDIDLDVTEAALRSWYGAGVTARRPKEPGRLTA